MNHPYLRAYMAGIVVPTAFLLVAMTVFTLARFVFEVPVPIERVVVFPMALIPNLFGVWNMLYVGLRSRSPLSIGAHGALLPFVIVPLGLTLGRCSASSGSIRTECTPSKRSDCRTPGAFSCCPLSSSCTTSCGSTSSGS